MGSTAREVVVGLLAVNSLQLAVAHSFVAHLELMKNHTPTGIIGYPRGYVNASLSTFDFEMTHLLPADQRPLLTSDDRMCQPSQSGQNVTYPRLKAPAGSVVALRYREGGHITLAARRPEKLTTGSVSVYGTSVPSADERLLDVHLVWNANQTGGNGHGRLLGRSSFDDGTCFENNNSSLSRLRQHDLPPEVSVDDGGHSICSVHVLIPADLHDGSLFTLYWVWDWPSVRWPTGDRGKAELYTTCIDIEVG